ncbi:MAG: hypothetical protein ACJ79J_10860 [Gemmatimonadaceae bacterium]
MSNRRIIEFSGAAGWAKRGYDFRRQMGCTCNGAVGRATGQKRRLGAAQEHFARSLGDEQMMQ